MTANRTLFVCLLCSVPVQGIAQVTLGGQVSADFLKSAPTQSQRVFDAGRPSFGWEADLFADGKITDNVAFLGNVRITDDEYVHIDYLAIWASAATPGETPSSTCP